VSRTAQALCMILLASMALAEPKVANPSFETDRFGKWPGYVGHNGHKITGWTFTGSVGINPVWNDTAKPAGPRHAFSDNARVPHGRQVAFIQNVGALKQSVAGFEKGKRYRVVYCENARHNNAATRNPRLKVTLGGEVVVSEHRIEPVERIDRRTLPYNLVESAVFTAPRDGAFELVFATSFGDRVAVLIDHVRIVPIER